MNIIVLAAGMGSRLYPYTKNTPKSLIPINNTTLFETNINNLKKVYPEAELNVVVGFEYPQFENILKDLDCNIIYNPFYKDTNSIASLWLARNVLEQEGVLIYNADVFNSLCTLQYIKNCKLENFVTVDSNKQCTDADYKVVTDKDHIIDMGKNVKHDTYYGEYCGITKLSLSGAYMLYDKIDLMVKNGNYGTWYETALVNLIKEDSFNLNYLDLKDYIWAELDVEKDLSYLKTLIK